MYKIYTWNIQNPSTIKYMYIEPEILLPIYLNPMWKKSAFSGLNSVCIHFKRSLCRVQCLLANVVTYFGYTVILKYISMGLVIKSTRTGNGCNSKVVSAFHWVVNWNSFHSIYTYLVLICLVRKVGGGGEGVKSSHWEKHVPQLPSLLEL